MSTKTQTTGADPQALSDSEAVMKHVIDGTPIEPELRKRIRERANRITEQVWRKHGYIDVDKLVRDARDEA
jgi:hypothetical protein